MAHCADRFMPVLPLFWGILIRLTPLATLCLALEGTVLMQIYGSTSQESLVNRAAIRSEIQRAWI